MGSSEVGLKHMREKYRRPCRSLKLRSHYREKLTVELSLDEVSGREVAKTTCDDLRKLKGLGAAKLPPMLEDSSHHFSPGCRSILLCDLLLQPYRATRVAATMVVYFIYVHGYAGHSKV